MALNVSRGHAQGERKGRTFWDSISKLFSVVGVISTDSYDLAVSPSHIYTCTD
jgi:hypothetical protein